MISPVPTHPPIAGNRARVLAVGEALRALKHEVFFVHVKRDPGDAALMRDYWGESYIPLAFRRPPLTQGLPLRCVRWGARLLRRGEWYRWGLDDWYDEGLTSPLKRLAAERDFEVVIVEYVYLSKALQCFGAGVLKMLDTHDVMTNRHRLFLQNRRFPQWFSLSAQDEATGLARADVVIAIQEGERRFFRTITDRPVIVVPHVAAISNCFSPSLSRPHPVVLFVGSDNAVNVDGMHWFMKNVWPRLQDRLPAAQLWAAGRVCGHLPDASGLKKFGVVDDLAMAYGQADVVINPVTWGTGLNIKSIEALGHGMPLVTTNAGAKGLGSPSRPAWRIADDPVQFADAVYGLLKDRAAGGELSRSALGFVGEWNRTCMAELVAVLETCAARRAGGGAVPGAVVQGMGQGT